MKDLLTNFYASQVGAERQFFFEGIHHIRPAADLVIAEIPDGMPVPGISTESSTVPVWNALVPDFLKIVIGFSRKFMHDDGALLLFHPDNPQLKREIGSWLNNNNLKHKDDWMIVNSMHLTHPTTPDKYVSDSFVFIYPYTLSLFSKS